MLPSKKPQNPSKFNSMAQIQIKCVKLTKTPVNNKSNRSNSSLNLTSPPQNKGDKPEEPQSIKQKLQAINNQNAINLTNNNTPKNYFLMPTHNPNSSLSRSKTLHHSKMNLINSHNDQLNESNKENYVHKCQSPMQNSMGLLSRTQRDTSREEKEASVVKNSIKSKRIIAEENSSLSHRNRNLMANEWQIQERDEKSNEKVTEFFCLRHPAKKAKYFIKGKTVEDLVFCCSKCAIDLASQGKKIMDIHEELKESSGSSEHFSKIPEETSKNTIIDELNENVMEIDSREINKRDVDLSKFIRKLQILKQECATAYEQLNSRKKDIIFFYDKQIIKLDQIYNNLLRVIEKEKNQSTAKLKQFMGSTTANFNNMISQMEGNMKDMNFIFNDIEQNRPNILRHMETDPFNLILSKYEEKLNHYQDYWQSLYVEKLLLEKMTNSSIKHYQKKIEEVLTPHIMGLFSTFEVSTSYLKKDVSIESESPIPLEKNLPKYNIFSKPPNENNSIYISFENKEMFENAIRTSMAFKGATNPASNMNLGSAVIDLVHQNQNESLGNKAVPLLNPEVASLPFQINPDQKPSDSKNSSSTLSNNNKENDFITTPKSTEKCIREFNSAQPGKLMNNLNKENPNKNKNKRFQSTDKLQNKKYLTLLEKVSNNQNNTNVFYSNIMQTNAPMTSPSSEKNIYYSNIMQTNAPMTSPPSEKHEGKGIFQSLDHKMNLFEFNKARISEGKANIIQASPFKSGQNKEIKNYEGFFNFIENKLQDEPENKMNVGGLMGNANVGSYQKTLFCSSPHFKDV